jgi:hypothetical protein
MPKNLGSLIHEICPRPIPRAVFAPNPPVVPDIAAIERQQRENMERVRYFQERDARLSYMGTW